MKLNIKKVGDTTLVLLILVSILSVARLGWLRRTKRYLGGSDEQIEAYLGGLDEQNATAVEVRVARLNGDEKVVNVPKWKGLCTVMDFHLAVWRSWPDIRGCTFACNGQILDAALEVVPEEFLKEGASITAVLLSTGTVHELRNLLGNDRIKRLSDATLYQLSFLEMTEKAKESAEMAERWLFMVVRFSLSC